MNFFKNRFVSIFFIALVAVLILLTTPSKKESHATSGLLSAALQAAEKLVIEQVNKSFTAMADNLTQTILGDYLPFAKDLWQSLAQERLQADIAKTEQEGIIQNAVLAQEAVNKQEEIALEEAKNAKPSYGECQVVTSTHLSNSGLMEVENRREEFNTLITGDQTNAPGSITEKGPVVAHRELLEFRLNNSCSQDEYGGNLANICNNNNADNVDKDLRTDLLTECHTFPRADEDYVKQMVRYLTLDFDNMQPLSAVDLEDPDSQKVQINRIMERTQRASYVNYISHVAAMRMEPATCPEVDGVSRLDFVNEIDLELGRTDRITPNRPCPSQAEFECYRTNRQFKSPQFALKCNEGEAQLQRCIMLHESIKAELAYDTKTLQEQRAVMNGSIGP